MIGKVFVPVEHQKIFCTIGSCRSKYDGCAPRFSDFSLYHEIMSNFPETCDIWWQMWIEVINIPAHSDGVGKFSILRINVKQISWKLRKHIISDNQLLQGWRRISSSILIYEKILKQPKSEGNTFTSKSVLLLIF